MIEAKWQAPCDLRLTGHAGFAPVGGDIVCAGVSALWGALSYELDDWQDKGRGRLLEEDGLLCFCPEARWEREAVALFRLTWRGLEMIAGSYPANVRTEKNW